DDLNVRPGRQTARQAVAEKESNLTNYDTVRVDLAEKANHDPVTQNAVLWHCLLTYFGSPRATVLYRSPLELPRHQDRPKCGQGRGREVCRFELLLWLARVDGLRLAWL